MRSNFLYVSLLGVTPALSLVIPDDITTQRVFNAASNDPVVKPLADAITPAVREFAEKINSFLPESVVEAKPGVEDTFLGHKWVGERYGAFDGAAWIEQMIESEEDPSASRHHDRDHYHGKPDHGHEKPPRDPHGPHPEESLLDLISSSKHSSGFYNHIKDRKAFTDLLGDNSRNFTVFIPSNEAFESLDKYRKHYDLPDDVLEKILWYHFAEGTHDYKNLLYHNTLVTKLSVDELGKGNHQRLRIGPGPHVNLYSRMKMVDIYGKNGVIHGINAILVPPPSIYETLKILPTVFSTTQAALAYTGLTDELRKLTGGTVFLPTNKQWMKLGIVINAFLFSEYGKPYLTALMKYHIVSRVTLYSDALVKSEEKAMDERDDPDGLTHGYSHQWLPTLLGDKHISSDIHRWGRFLSFRVNGMNSVVLSDGIARNGVIQVPDNILIPPHTLAEHHDPPKVSGEHGVYGISLEEFKAILEPMVQRDAVDSEL